MDKMPDFMNQFAIVDFLSYFIPGVFFVGYEYWLLAETYRPLLNGPVNALFPENVVAQGLSFIACAYITGMLLGMIGSTAWEKLYKEIAGQEMLKKEIEEEKDEKQKNQKNTNLQKNYKKFLLRFLKYGALFCLAARLFPGIWKCFWTASDLVTGMTNLSTVKDTILKTLSCKKARDYIIQIIQTAGWCFWGGLAGMLTAVTLLGLGTDVARQSTTSQAPEEIQRKRKLFQSFQLMFRGLSTAVVCLLFQLCSEKTSVEGTELGKVLALVFYCLLGLLVSRGMKYKKYYDSYCNAANEGSGQVNL